MIKFVHVVEERLWYPSVHTFEYPKSQETVCIFLLLVIATFPLEDQEDF